MDKRNNDMRNDAAPNNAAEYDFDEAFNRMCTVVGIKTQKSLGLVLGISQPSVHYARAKQCIPTTWLLKLAHLGVNPVWILHGDPNKPYLQTTDVAPTSGPAATSEFATTRVIAPGTVLRGTGTQAKGGCDGETTAGTGDTVPAAWEMPNTIHEVTKDTGRFQSI